MKSLAFIFSLIIPIAIGGVLYVRYSWNPVLCALISLIPVYVIAPFEYKIRERAALSLYLKRKPQTKQWFARFGRERKVKIREFLQLFTFCYGFPNRLLCKLSPDDQVITYYKRSYSDPMAPDCMENEVFFDAIGEKFGFTPLLSQELTLGDLFELTIKSNKSSIGISRREASRNPIS